VAVFQVRCHSTATPDTATNARVNGVLLGIDNNHSQREIAAERERIIPLIQVEIDRAQPPPLQPTEYDRLCRTAREIQDVILATRKQAVRVPEWFYARFRDVDEQDFQPAPTTSAANWGTPEAPRTCAAVVLELESQ
jgi:hypothetical protein